MPYRTSGAHVVSEFMSIRELFACQLMAAMVSSNLDEVDAETLDPAGIADLAVSYADELIATLNRRPDKSDSIMGAKHDAEQP